MGAGILPSHYAAVADSIVGPNNGITPGQGTTLENHKCACFGRNRLPARRLVASISILGRLALSACTYDEPEQRSGAFSGSYADGDDIPLLYGDRLRRPLFSAAFPTSSIGRIWNCGGRRG